MSEGSERATGRNPFFDPNRVQIDETWDVSASGVVRRAEPSLTEFLLARLAEDEAAAREAIGESWTSWVEGRDGFGGDDVILTGATGIYLRYDWHGADFTATQDHIARHDPARVLAEVEAKRRIVEMCDAPMDRAAEGLGELVIKELASVYSDHAEWREEWRA